MTANHKSDPAAYDSWYETSRGRRVDERETARFRGMPLERPRVCTALHLPYGGRCAQAAERMWPRRLHTGAFILVVANVK